MAGKNKECSAGYGRKTGTGMQRDLRKITARSLAQFRKTILTYYHEKGRDLPWRHTTDPYHILVSEIMLQQTQVHRVEKKYPEFLAAFPTFADLAHAPLSSVLAVWQGMGYNRRAITLRACAQKVMDNYGGELPADTGILAMFPGIGQATACSIAAFAFNMPVVFIETNIRRVFIHFFFDGRINITDAEIFPLVEKTLVRQDPRTMYSALMDYGTMLKNKVPNPNQRSAHYTKQSRFEGSDREMRGLVIKALVKEPEIDEKNLIRVYGEDTEKICHIIRILEKEGFVHRKNGFIRLSE